MAKKRTLTRETLPNNNTSDLRQMHQKAEELFNTEDSQSQKESIPLLKILAESGNPWAQYSLGLAYQNGWGVKKNSKLAMKYYEQSSRQGYDSALLNLGILIARNSTDQEEGYKEAIKLYRRAAARGNTNACYNIGLYYLEGRGVKPNRRQSFKWHLRAAQAGELDSQCFVGYSYFYGEGVRQDMRLALAWYRKSAAQGNSSAQYNLGLCYLNGEGVKKSQKTAIEWFKKAESNGHEQASHTLRALTHPYSDLEQVD